MTEPATLPVDPFLERQLALLGRLAEAGLQIAIALERQARAAADGDDRACVEPVARGDVALAYARVSRAVRMTVLLQSRLIQDAKAQREAEGRERALAQAARDQARIDLRQAHKARVERIVVRVAAAACDDEEELERLFEDARDLLDDDDIQGEVMNLSVSELVDRICRDLGLEPDWPALAEEAWARDEIAGGAPGGPLAALTAPPDAGAGAKGAGPAPPPRPPDGPGDP